jgi:hypothetical protein
VSRPSPRCRGRALAVPLVLALAACGSDEVSSAEEARLAYLGLDRAVERALNLGMDGYNAAQSANIPPQTGSGDVSGTLTVTGQVDQGASSNKEMRLATAFVMYQDRLGALVDAGQPPASEITYDTHEAALPDLALSLRNIPSDTSSTGTFTGTFAGNLVMSGRLQGNIVLSLALSGTLQAAGGTAIGRVAGSTYVTGTATSRYGTYTIDLTR